MVEHNGEADSSALGRWSRRKQNARNQSPKQLATSSGVQPSSDVGLQNAGEEKVSLPKQESLPKQLGSEELTPEELTPEEVLTQQQAAGEDQCGMPQHPAVTGETDEPLLSDDDMPQIESLDSGSDVSCFFNAGVSEKLRQAALRHLLRLPAFNITDGLNDYDEDYTTFEPLGDIVTSDMRFHAKRKAKLAEEQRLEAERLEAEQLEAERLETEQLEAEQLETEQLEAEQLEAEQLEAEQLETEQLEAEQLEAEQLEAEQLEAEQLEAEQLEAEQLEAEQLATNTELENS